jgi:hypothetical protein
VIDRIKVWYLPGVAERFGIGEHPSKQPLTSTNFLQRKELSEDHYSNILEDLIPN